MEPKSNNWYFYKKKKKKRGDTEVQRRESYVKTEAEFRVTGNPRVPRKPQDCRQPPEASLEAPGGTNPAGTVISDFWPPEPRENRFLLF